MNGGCPRHGVCAWVLGVILPCQSLRVRPAHQPEPRESPRLSAACWRELCGAFLVFLCNKGTLSFRAERPDFLFRAAFRRVGPRREESLLGFSGRLAYLFLCEPLRPLRCLTLTLTLTLSCFLISDL